MPASAHGLRALAVTLVVAVAALAPGAAAHASPTPTPTPSPSSAAPARGTSVALSVEPGNELETYTPATFRASVSPVDVPGVVTFSANGVAIGAVPVVGGQAVLESNSRDAGTMSLTATFTPDGQAGFASAVSSAVAVQVNGVPRIWLTTRDGATIPTGSQVKTGSAVRIRIEGFPAKTLVTFMLGTYALPSAIATNGSGSGSALVVIPQDIPSSIYVLSAAGGRRSAAFIFYVFNPALQPTPIPSHTVDNITTSIPPKGGSSSGGSDNGSASGTPTPTPTSTSTGGTDDGNGIPDTGGSGGTLPHTGSDPTDLGLAAVVAFGLGLGLVAAGRRQRPIGRHAHR